jgi:regulator of replication initiation timing
VSLRDKIEEVFDEERSLRFNDFQLRKKVLGLLDQKIKEIQAKKDGSVLSENQEIRDLARELYAFGFEDACKEILELLGGKTEAKP